MLFCLIFISDSYKNLFTINVHHLGKFIKNPNRQYVDGKLNAVDLVDESTFTLEELHSMIRELGYEDDHTRYYHFLRPDTDLDKGLHPLATHRDVITMLHYIPRWQDIHVFVEHGITTVESMKTGVIIEEIDDELNSYEVVKPRQLLIQYVKEPEMESNEPLMGANEPIMESNEPLMEPTIEPTEPIEPSDTEHESSENSDNEDSEETDDSQDSDFEPEEHNMVHDVEVDMKDFKMHVDMEVEWIGKTVQPNVGELELNEEVVGIDFDEFDSGNDSDHIDSKRKLRLKHLRQKMDRKLQQGVNTRFYVGQTFGSSKKLKEVIKLHAIETRRNLKLDKNDKVRVRVRCHGQTPHYRTKGALLREINQVVLNASPQKGKSVKIGEELKEVHAKGKSVKPLNEKDTKGKGVVVEDSEKVEGETMKPKKKKVKAAKPTCPWTLHVSKGKDEDKWMVKTFIEDHKCLQNRSLRQCSSTFLSHHIGDSVTADPDITGGALQDLLSKKFELGIKRMTAYRAKEKATARLMGDHKNQYSRLRDYCLELQQRNPNTTVKVCLFNCWFKSSTNGD